MKIKLTKDNLVKTLNLLYWIFNKLLFDSTLPKLRVSARSLEKDQLLGYYDFDKETRSPLGGIVISTKASDPVKVLIHEMTHVYHISVLKRPISGSYHPPSFVRILESKYKKLGYELDPNDVL